MKKNTYNSLLNFKIKNIEYIMIKSISRQNKSSLTDNQKIAKTLRLLIQNTMELKRNKEIDNYILLSLDYLDGNNHINIQDIYDKFANIYEKYNQELLNNKQISENLIALAIYSELTRIGITKNKNLGNRDKAKKILEKILFSWDVPDPVKLVFYYLFYRIFEKEIRLSINKTKIEEILSIFLDVFSKNQKNPEFLYLKEEIDYLYKLINKLSNSKLEYLNESFQTNKSINNLEQYHGTTVNWQTIIKLRQKDQIKALDDFFGSDYNVYIKNNIEDNEYNILQNNNNQKIKVKFKVSKKLKCDEEKETNKVKKKILFSQYHISGKPSEFCKKSQKFKYLTWNNDKHKYCCDEKEDDTEKKLKHIKYVLYNMLQNIEYNEKTMNSFYFAFQVYMFTFKKFCIESGINPNEIDKILSNQMEKILKLSKAFFVSLESERKQEKYEKELAEINLKKITINKNSNQWKKYEQNLAKLNKLPFTIP